MGRMTTVFRYAISYVIVAGRFWSIFEVKLADINFTKRFYISPQMYSPKIMAKISKNTILPVRPYQSNRLLNQLMLFILGSMGLMPISNDLIMKVTLEWRVIQMIREKAVSQIWIKCFTRWGQLKCMLRGFAIFLL